MKRSLTLVLCVFVALAITTLARQTEAAKPDAPGSRGAVRQILPDETEPSELRGNRRISLDTGVPLALYRLSYRTNPGRTRCNNGFALAIGSRMVRCRDRHGPHDGG